MVGIYFSTVNTVLHEEVTDMDVSCLLGCGSSLGCERHGTKVVLEDISRAHGVSLSDKEISAPDYLAQ